MASTNIKVAVRIRPMLDEEQTKGHTCTKMMIDEQEGLIRMFSEEGN